MNTQFFKYQTFTTPRPLNQVEFNFLFFGPSIPSESFIYQPLMTNPTNIKMLQICNFQAQNKCFNPSSNINWIPNKEEVFNVKQTAKSLKIESLSTLSEEIQKNIKSPFQRANPTFKQPNSDLSLKSELEKIITFLLLNMGKNNQTQIDNFRRLYFHHPCLLQIYDKLVMKYFSAKKCREDIVRYILRKVFKVIRASIMKKEKVCNKKAAIILCKKYFQKSFERIQESGVNVSNEDELIEFFMPYKKKSKNRTMNTTFVLEVFSSEDFCKEYQQFLAEFDSFLEADNNKKKEKLMDFLMECIKEDSLPKIGSYNRLPWLDLWIQDTKNIAFDLIPNQETYENKKAKTN